VSCARSRSSWLVRALCLPSLTLLVACGSPSTTSAGGTEHPTTSPGPSRPMLTGTVQTAEDVSLTAPFRVPIQVATSGDPTPAAKDVACADYAAGVHNGFVAPVFDVKSDDHGIYFVGTSTAYHGPGVYNSQTDRSLGGTIAVAVGVAAGQQPAYSIFRSHINGSSTLTVHANGSGTFTFSQWGSDEVRGDTGTAATISGKVTWTCH
jgi:hypothetical protein